MPQCSETRQQQGKLSSTNGGWRTPTSDSGCPRVHHLAPRPRVCLPLVPSILFAVLLLEGDFLRLFFFLTCMEMLTLFSWPFPLSPFQVTFHCCGMLIVQLTSVLVTTWHQTVGSSMHFLRASDVLPCQRNPRSLEQNIHPAVTFWPSMYWCNSPLSTCKFYTYINASLFAGLSNHHKACLIAREANKTGNTLCYSVLLLTHSDKTRALAACDHGRKL